MPSGAFVSRRNVTDYPPINLGTGRSVQKFSISGGAGFQYVCALLDNGKVVNSLEYPMLIIALLGSCFWIAY